MALTTYNYSVQNDFPNQAVDVGSLDSEIRANAGITIELDGIEHEFDDIKITFIDPLPAPEKTVLDGIVATHTGLPLIDTPQRVQAGPEQTNITTTYEDAVVLSPGALKGGSWQVTWYSEIAVESVVNNSGAFARLTVDGTERTFSSNRDDQYQSFSGSALMTVNDGEAPEIKLQFERAGAANTAKIRRCQIAMVLEDAQ